MSMDEIYDLVVQDLERSDLQVCSDSIVEGMVEFISLQDTGEVEGIEYGEDLYETVADYMMTRVGVVNEE